MKNCTALWREAHFEVKMLKAPHCRSTFGSSDVETVPPAVARSAFGSQNVKSARCSKSFWMFRCSKEHFEVKSVKNWRSRSIFGS